VILKLVRRHHDRQIIYVKDRTKHADLSPAARAGGRTASTGCRPLSTA